MRVFVDLDIDMADALVPGVAHATHGDNGHI